MKRTGILLGSVITAILLVSVVNSFAGWNLQFFSSGNTNNCPWGSCTGGCTDTYNPDLFCAPGFYYCPNSAGAVVTLTLTPGNCTGPFTIGCGCPPSGAPATSPPGIAVC